MKQRTIIILIIFGIFAAIAIYFLTKEASIEEQTTSSRISTEGGLDDLIGGFIDIFRKK